MSLSQSQYVPPDAGPRTTYSANHCCEKGSINHSLVHIAIDGPIPDDWPGYTRAELLQTQSNYTLLVTGVLASPLISATNMPSIVTNSALWTMAVSACVIDAVGFVIALVFCIRLWHMRSKGQYGSLEMDSHRDWSGRILSTISPIVLVTSSMLLFLIALSGTLFAKNTKN
ncbi:hypothetical protein PsYK624_048100 [Phanerochaete sordida]|uniref:Uncharacterized protein n=1 Tax=Phanerochaete sordida TaxID=48140 RepID=A0A9P3G613_9APHY|nr:hypothetical protein PsYK624_048100 [Phanerochaete sordida]